MFFYHALLGIVFRIKFYTQLYFMKIIILFIVPNLAIKKIDVQKSQSPNKKKSVICKESQQNQCSTRQENDLLEEVCNKFIYFIYLLFEYN